MLKSILALGIFSPSYVFSYDILMLILLFKKCIFCLDFASLSILIIIFSCHKHHFLEDYYSVLFYRLVCCYLLQILYLFQLLLFGFKYDFNLLFWIKYCFCKHIYVIVYYYFIYVFTSHCKNPLELYQSFSFLCCYFLFIFCLFIQILHTLLLKMKIFSVTFYIFYYLFETFVIFLISVMIASFITS